MLHREITTVHSENHTKFISAVCRQIAEFSSVKTIVVTAVLQSVTEQVDYTINKQHELQQNADYSALVHSTFRVNRLSLSFFKVSLNSEF
jgi:hypothetical protein